jgi:hypothetical protein
MVRLPLNFDLGQKLPIQARDIDLLILQLDDPRRIPDEAFLAIQSL